MENKKWFYKHEGRVLGPVSTEELVELFQKKMIQGSTVISEKGSDTWITLEESEICSTFDIDDKSPEVREKNLSGEAEDQSAVLGKPHPWHRFWARMLDYLIFGTVVANIFGAFLPRKGFFPPFLSMGLIFIWAFIEAALLCSWKKTIGKWLFNIKVETESGKAMNYSRAISRSLSVWFLGLAAGLPLISIITMIVACVKLSNNSITTWDKITS